MCSEADDPSTYDAKAVHMSARCLNCGTEAPDPLAGCCPECGAEDRFIGTQWLTVPHDQRPLDAKAVHGDGLREALAFVADWAHDCSPSNRAAPWERQHGDEIDPRSYGFDDIEERCRAALGGDKP